MRLNKRKFWSKLKQAVERMNADEEDCFRWSFERVGTNCAIAEKTELTWDHYQLRFSDEMGSARIEAYVVVLHEHQDTEVFMSEHLSLIHI